MTPNLKIFILTSIMTGVAIFTNGQEYLSKELKPIKENFRTINLIKHWTKVKQIDLRETAEGGDAIFYYSNDGLTKIVARRFGETFQDITEYYLLKGKLSFVFERIYKYNRPMTWDSTAMKETKDDQVWDIKKSEILENRSYFKDNKLIHQINNEDCGSPFSDEYLTEEGKTIMTGFQKLLEPVKGKS